MIDDCDRSVCSVCGGNGAATEQGKQGMKLSDAQMRFLRETAQHGHNRTPFTGGKEAGRNASAWYRTAESLWRKGLIEIERVGDSQVAVLTTVGEYLMQKENIS